MKNLWLLIFFALIGAGNCFAQQNGYGQHSHGDYQGGQQQGNGKQQSPDDRAKAFVSKLSEKMDVTSQQKDSLQFIFKKFFTDLQTYKTQDNPDIFDELKSKRDNSVKQVLADSSKYAAYQNYMFAMQHAHQNNQSNTNNDQDQNWHHGQNGDDQNFPGDNNPH
jgi:hypothetical protein